MGRCQTGLLRLRAPLDCCFLCLPVSGHVDMFPPNPNREIRSEALSLHVLDNPKYYDEWAGGDPHILEQNESPQLSWQGADPKCPNEFADINQTAIVEILLRQT